MRQAAKVRFQQRNVREEALHVTGESRVPGKRNCMHGRSSRGWKEIGRGVVAARGREVRRDSLRPRKPWRILSISDGI